MKTRTSATAAVEPGKIPNPEDAVENKLHSAVRSGLIPPATAQKAIAGNWTTAFDDAGSASPAARSASETPRPSAPPANCGDEDGN
ncbi:hypothetical protein [Amycolatopsis sp. cmx-8-4]|uniref:hypothetical protein n=1 Tax=Amycolatopsis sp. cmx-8-4 TaxID=2790947 RepID=UPI00397B4097